MMAPKNAKPKVELAASTTLASSQPVALPIADGGSGIANAGTPNEAQAPAPEHFEILNSDEGSSSADVISSASTDIQVVDSVAEPEALLPDTNATTAYSAAVEPASETNSTDTTQSEAANGEAGDAASLSAPGMLEMFRDGVLGVLDARSVTPTRRLPPPFLGAGGTAREFSSDELVGSVRMARNVKIDGVLLEVDQWYPVPQDIYFQLRDIPGALAEEDD